MRLLTESIQEITTGSNFYGFITIKQLANDILYSLLSSSLDGYAISADMLTGFSKDSAYVKRIKKNAGSKNVIGFGIARDEH